MFWLYILRRAHIDAPCTTTRHWRYFASCVRCSEYKSRGITGHAPAVADLSAPSLRALAGHHRRQLAAFDARAAALERAAREEAAVSEGAATVTEVAATEAAVSEEGAAGAVSALDAQDEALLARLCE